jgi:LPXTG-site transpeptidase (sortase) family protein
VTLPRMPRILLSLVASGLLALATSAPAIGYIEQSQIQVILGGPGGAVRCNRSATITATVRSTENGRPIANQAVTWRITQAQSPGDSLSATRTTTNRRGRTSVTLSFGPAAGRRTVSATAGVTSPTISVRCAGGLPQTSTRPPDGFEAEAPSLLLPPAVAEPGTGEPIAALRIERLGIDLPVLAGDGVSVPDGAAAHFPDTALPGEGSNTYLYAHAREGQFLGLWQARTGDRVEVQLADGSVAEYRVSRILPMVAWDDLDVLAPTDEEQLTLQTCLTYDETAPRFVVIASRVAGA